MKRLQDFINEHVELNESSTESKTITFNFKGLDNAKDTLEALQTAEYCTVEEEQATVTVDANNAAKLSMIQDILKKYSDEIRNSTHRSSDEQYAQKTKSFEDKVIELNNTIDEFQKVEEPEEKKEEDKEEDE